MRSPDQFEITWRQRRFNEWNHERIPVSLWFKAGAHGRQQSNCSNRERGPLTTHPRRPSHSDTFCVDVVAELGKTDHPDRKDGT